MNARAMILAAAAALAHLAAPAPVLAQSGLPREVASAGVTVAQWEAVRAEVRRRATEARVSERALQAAAEATGARFAASGQFNALSLQSAVIEALEDQTEQLAELEARLERLTGDTEPEVARLFTAARAALDAGRLREADRLLADVASRDLAGLQRADAETERLRLRAADTIASRGQVAFLQADYRGAASHFARAAETAPDSARAVRWRYRMGEGGALSTQGERFETAALIDARTVIEARALPLAPRATAPQDWAITHNDLGAVLAILAERQSEPQQSASLHSARRAFESALTVLSREREPADWARAQMNLGNVLRLIGEKQRGQEGQGILESARAAFDAALTVFSRDTYAREWSLTVMNSGILLARLAERQRGQDGLATLYRARTAFETVLSFWTPGSDPVGSAQVQMNLGTVLLEIGRHETGAQKIVSLEAARAAFADSLMAISRETAPVPWAMIQSNLGSLEWEFGAIDEDGAAYDRARTHYRLALEVLTDSGMRRHIQENLASVPHNPRRRISQRERLILSPPISASERARDLAALGDAHLRGGASQAGAEGSASLESARAAFTAALTVLTPEMDPDGWVNAQVGLGNALWRLAERQAGAEGLASLTAARAAFDRALEVRTRAANPPGWAGVQVNLGIALMRLGERQAGAEGVENLTAARGAYDRALEVFTRSTNPQGWADVQMNLGVVLRNLGERQAGAEGLASLTAARAAYDRALEVRTRETNPHRWAQVQMNLGVLEVTIGDRGGGRAAYERAIGHYRAALEVFMDGEVRRVVEANIAIAERKLAAAPQ